MYFTVFYLHNCLEVNLFHVIPLPKFKRKAMSSAHSPEILFKVREEWERQTKEILMDWSYMILCRQSSSSTDYRGKPLAERRHVDSPHRHSDYVSKIGWNNQSLNQYQTLNCIHLPSCVHDSCWQWLLLCFLHHIVLYICEFKYIHFLYDFKFEVRVSQFVALFIFHRKSSSGMKMIPLLSLSEPYFLGWHCKLEHSDIIHQSIFCSFPSVNHHCAFNCELLHMSLCLRYPSLQHFRSFIKPNMCKHSPGLKALEDDFLGLNKNTLSVGSSKFLVVFFRVFYPRCSHLARC